MPIYEYACAACGHEFEEWQKMSDAPVRTCPKCKKKKVERLISRTAFQLKGGGWYADLYSSSKPGEGKGADKAESKADSGKDSAAPAKESTGGSEGSSKGAGKTGDTAGSSASTKKKSAKKAESRAA